LPTDQVPSLDASQFDREMRGVDRAFSDFERTIRRLGG
jgi:hypothetical protein